VELLLALTQDVTTRYVRRSRSERESSPRPGAIQQPFNLASLSGSQRVEAVLNRFAKGGLSTEGLLPLEILENAVAGSCGRRRPGPAPPRSRDALRAGHR
jgi:hypothetical protein